MWVDQTGIYRFFRINLFWEDRNWDTFVNELRSGWATGIGTSG